MNMHQIHQQGTCSESRGSDNFMQNSTKLSQASYESILMESHDCILAFVSTMLYASLEYVYTKYQQLWSHLHAAYSCESQIKTRIWHRWRPKIDV